MGGARSKASWLSLAVILGALWTPSCGGDDMPSSCEDDVPEATLTSLQATLLGPSCGYVGCHGGSAPRASLDLSSTDASMAGLVNVAAVTTERDHFLVVPGKPEESYLLNKLTDTGIESNSEFPDAEAMPAAGDALCEETIAAVELWIENGCPL